MVIRTFQNRTPRLFFRLLLTFVGLPCFGLGAGLRIECEFNGEILPLAAVVKESLLVRRGEAMVPVPEGAVWHLTGDLVENADLVRWAPRHKMEEQPLAEYNGFQRVIKTEISVEGKEHAFNAAKFTLSDWPAAQPADSAIVAVWMIKGKPVKVQIRPLESPANDGWAGKFHLLLSPVEAEGQPVLLLWTKGEFLPPQPEFSDKLTQLAFVSALTDDVAGLKNALSTGGKLKKKSRAGASLAHYAAMANAPKALEFLVQQEPSFANVTSESESDTPLRWAALTGRVATVQILLQAGASPIPRHDDSLANPVRVSSHVTFGQMVTGPMASAVLVGHTEVVQLLVKAGAAIHAEHGTEPVDSAVMGGYADIAEILLRAGGAHDFKPQGNGMAYDAREGREPIVRFLLEHGVDPNSCIYVNEPADTGVTALMGTAQSNSVQTAATLLAYGATPNLKTPDGVTALHVAAEANSPDIVRLLLAHHADATIRNNAGLSALDVALLNDAKEAAVALAHGGARLDLHSANTQQLIEGALREDVADVISAAIADGWNPNTRIRGVCPALVLAHYFRANACEAVLHAAGAAGTDSHSFPLAKLSELDMALKPISSKMPGNQRLLSESETVQVEFVLNEDGHPIFAHVLDSPSLHLTVATLRALENWVFSKPTAAGKPARVRVVMPIMYKKSKNSFDYNFDLSIPEVLRRATPAYPVVMLPQKTIGKVALDFLVRADGSVSDVKVASSSNSVFENCALQTLRDYRFGPRMIHGQPVEDRMRLTVDILPP